MVLRMQTTGPSTRATVYFDGDVHRALRLKAAASGLTISDLVNRAVGAALAEDADDVQTHRDRVGEPVVDFADLVVSLKASGKI
jgi:hypothetical protein